MSEHVCRKRSLDNSSGVPSIVGTVSHMSITWETQPSPDRDGVLCKYPHIYEDARHTSQFPPWGWIYDIGHIHPHRQNVGRQDTWSSQ